jgi:hypothetical protein
VCAALDLPVGDLFTGGTAPVVRAADRAPVDFRGEGVTEWQLTPADDRRLLVLGAADWPHD